MQKPKIICCFDELVIHFYLYYNRCYTNNAAYLLIGLNVLCIQVKDLRSSIYIHMCMQIYCLINLRKYTYGGFSSYISFYIYNYHVYTKLCISVLKCALQDCIFEGVAKTFVNTASHVDMCVSVCVYKAYFNLVLFFYTEKY